MKPNFLYNTDGSIKQFGVGYRNKTVIPIWFTTICLAMLCYIFFHYLLILKKPHYYVN